MERCNSLMRIPRAFEAQELMTKNRSGEFVPYHPPFHLGSIEGSGVPSRRWIDGSLEVDLPIKQLKETPQCEPLCCEPDQSSHILLLLRFKKMLRSNGGKFAAKLVEMEVKHRCNQILEIGFPLVGVPKLFAQVMKAIHNPSYMELQKSANQVGEALLRQAASARPASSPCTDNSKNTEDHPSFTPHDPT